MRFEEFQKTPPPHLPDVIGRRTFLPEFMIPEVDKGQEDAKAKKKIINVLRGTVY